MTQQPSRSVTAFKIFIAILTWLALALQLYIMTGSKLSNGYALLIAICNYFSYFTILTNLLVALSLSFSWLWPSSAIGKFFSKPSTLTAVALYIFMVGLVYNIVLRSTWNPRGSQKVADEALHLIIPVLFVVFWLLNVPKGSLNWTHPFRWLIYPAAAYLTYALLRGQFTGFYAYFFINASELGYNRVLLNAGGLMVVFIIAGFVVVGIDKLMSRTKNRAFS